MSLECLLPCLVDPVFMLLDERHHFVTRHADGCRHMHIAILHDTHGQPARPPVCYLYPMFSVVIHLGRKKNDSGSGGNRNRHSRFAPSGQRTLTRVRPLPCNDSGSGGNRTLVHTRKPYAFYMLILAFIFVLQQDPSHQLQPYPLNFIRLSRPNLTIPDLTCTA